MERSESETSNDNDDFCWQDMNEDEEYIEDEDADNSKEVAQQLISSGQISAFSTDAGPYSVLSTEEIAELLLKVACEKAEQLGISEAKAVMAMHICREDGKGLREFEDVVLGEETRKKLGLWDDDEKWQQREGWCVVCGDAAIKALDCGHMVGCEGCWRGFLQSQLDDYGTVLQASCWEPKCPNLVDRYEQIERDSFKMLLGIINCPGVDCPYSIRMPSRVGNVVCKCGITFCFQCAFNHRLHANPSVLSSHAPATCDMMDEWSRLTDADSLGKTFLSIRMQKCPNAKCGAPVIKCGCLNVGKKVVCDDMDYCPNQACDHIHCTNCSYDFCWRCLGAWPHPNGSSCRQVRQSSQEYSKSTELARAHKVVMQHHSNWLSCRAQHRVRIADKTCDTITVRAFAVVTESERTCKFSLILAYFLKNELSKNLLLDHISHLEQLTTELQELLENRSDDSSDHLQKIRSFTDAVSAFQESMQRGMSEIEQGIESSKADKAASEYSTCIATIRQRIGKRIDKFDKVSLRRLAASCNYNPDRLLQLLL